jgi:hypothetical protein
MGPPPLPTSPPPPPAPAGTGSGALIRSASPVTKPPRPLTVATVVSQNSWIDSGRAASTPVRLVSSPGWKPRNPRPSCSTGVTVAVRRWPSRTYSIVMDWPPLSWRTARSCSNDSTGVPATATISSPASRPPVWAGLGVPAFSGTVRSIVVVAWPVPTPMVTSTIQMSRMATMKWVNDPAASTIARCQAGLLRNCRSGGVGVAAGLSAERSSSRKLPSFSYGLMPAILQKPPRGKALMPYSVSPFRNDQMVGPKPRKKRSTFIPKNLAVAKCPPSCRKMASMRARTKSVMPSRLVINSPGR